MVVVGLSGGIASGKSTVARLLAAHGAEVIDADSIGHAALAPGGSACGAVLARFGVAGPDGGVDRAKLGAVVFADPVARQDLEAITHPAIYAEMQRRLATQRPEGAVVVVDAPLLVETGGRRVLPIQALVVVVATPEQQVQRAVGRGTPAERALAVIAAQATLSQKMAAADYIIDNRGTEEELVTGVETFWQDLTARYGARPTAIGAPRA